MIEPTAALLPDGRLHFQHGPIDLIVTADGDKAAVVAAQRAAWRRFKTVLNELVDELTLLRQCSSQPVYGLVAQRMAAAVEPFAADEFVTPMAAVAGSVADEVLDCMTAAAPLSRAIVNNGGDIAVHLADGATASAQISSVTNIPLGAVQLDKTDGIGGLATSGRQGRSLSLGIADAVTVLAASAAQADVAATLIGNAVDLPGHPGISRVPAWELDPDSDLENRLVVADCAELSQRDIDAALARGQARAQDMIDSRRILGAALFLQGCTAVVGSATRSMIGWEGGKA